MYNGCGYGNYYGCSTCNTNTGSGYALILVLFILLVIIGAAASKKCKKSFLQRREISPIKASSVSGPDAKTVMSPSAFSAILLTIFMFL